MTGPTPPRRRIVAVADSDSYLKFAACTLSRFAASKPARDTGPDLEPDVSPWQRELLLLRSPTLPTTVQIAAATRGTFAAGTTPPVLPVHRLAAALRQRAPDVVLVAATGPVAAQALNAIWQLHPRPLTVTALPGMGLPATDKALHYRARADAFVAHSTAEVHAYGQRCRDLGLDLDILASRLPFLRSRWPDPDPASVSTMVFAAQARVPEDREQRCAILLSLARLARRRPDLRVAVKLRAWAGGPQTHHEPHPYERLWYELADAGRVDPESVGFVDGPMSDYLRPGTALATLSSTAALEAIDAGLPLLLIGDFGVNDELLNAAFSDSGCIGSLAELADGKFSHPRPGWLAHNYFHDQTVSLPSQLERLLAGPRRERRGSALGRPPVLGPLSVGRARLRTALPVPALRLIRSIRGSLPG